jgi:hypothetical protein
MVLHIPVRLETLNKERPIDDLLLALPECIEISLVDSANAEIYIDCSGFYLDHGMC